MLCFGEILILGLVERFKEYHRDLLSIRGRDIKLDMSLDAEQHDCYQLNNIIDFVKKQDSFQEPQKYFTKFGFDEIWMR